MTQQRQSDVNNNRLFGAISYLWLLCLIPLFWRRHSEFAVHHAKQGLVLLVAEFFATLLGWIPFIGYYLSMLMGLALAVLALFGIINALDGKFWKMPVLGYYAKKIRL